MARGAPHPSGAHRRQQCAQCRRRTALGPTLQGQPVRVSSPFPVESISPHRVLSTSEDRDSEISPQSEFATSCSTSSEPGNLDSSRRESTLSAMLTLPVTLNTRNRFLPVRLDRKLEGDMSIYRFDEGLGSGQRHTQQSLLGIQLTASCGESST